MLKIYEACWSNISRIISLSIPISFLAGLPSFVYLFYYPVLLCSFWQVIIQAFSSSSVFIFFISLPYQLAVLLVLLFLRMRGLKGCFGFFILQEELVCRMNWMSLVGYLLRIVEEINESIVEGRIQENVQLCIEEVSVLLAELTLVRYVRGAGVSTPYFGESVVICPLKANALRLAKIPSCVEALHSPLVVKNKTESWSITRRN